MMGIMLNQEGAFNPILLAQRSELLRQGISLSVCLFINIGQWASVSAHRSLKDRQYTGTQVDTSILETVTSWYQLKLSITTTSTTWYS